MGSICEAKNSRQIHVWDSLSLMFLLAGLIRQHGLLMLSNQIQSQLWFLRREMSESAYMCILINFTGCKVNDYINI